MSASYTKEFLVDAFCYRYDKSGLNTRNTRKIAWNYYDTVTKQKFREACALDAEALKEYKNYCLEAGIEY